MRVKKICIIYTGGTIGMMHSPDGYVPNPESFRSNLESIRDLNHPDAPIWDLVQFSPLLDSSDITVREGTKSALPSQSGTTTMTASSFSTAQTPWATPPPPCPSCWKTSPSP